VDDDDDDVVPKGRSLRDEDDERPSRRRRRDEEEEEEDRPSRRRRPVDDDEEEERPSRRRRPAEDEEEERPRRKRRRSGGGRMEPHRGVMILVFGILSLFCCPLIFGSLAISFANTDLAKMDDGTMDDSGAGLTKAGRVIGIVGLILWACWMVLRVVLAVAG
jgi:hypothetical protein